MRGVLAEALDQAYLIEAMDAVMRKYGGTTRIWRTDRLATVIVPGTRDVQASFAPVAKHYGAIVEPCPPRRGNRKGVVESAVRLRLWAVVADHDRHQPGRGTGEPGPVLFGHRRCPVAPSGTGHM